MINLEFAMRRLGWLGRLGWLVVALACCLAWCPKSVCQKPQSVEWALDDQSMVVGWINPSRAEFESLRLLATNLGMGDESNEPLAEAKSTIESLRAASATRIYLVADFSAIMGQPPLVLITAKDPAAVMKVFQPMVPSQSALEIKAQGSMVMIGPKQRIDRLQGGKRSTPNAKLSEVLVEASSDHGLVVAIPSVPREMLSTVLETNPNKSEGQFAASLVRGLESGRFTLNEKEKRFELKLGFINPETAEYVGKAAGDLIANDAKIPKQLRPTVIESTLTWQVVGIDNLNQLLKSIPWIREARDEAKAMQGMNNLKQVALAFHNFESAYQTFVPQTLTSKDGKKLLSWRVMILPFIEQLELYNQFHLDEPWDSEHNIKLVDRIPKIYESAGAGKGKTTIQTLLTPQSVFGRQGKPVQFRDITDGTSNTIWLVEVDPADSVVWTKPEDYVAETEEAYTRLFANRKQVPFGFVDGSVRRFDSKLTYEVFKQLLSIKGGEVVQLP